MMMIFIEENFLTKSGFQKRLLCKKTFKIYDYKFYRIIIKNIHIKIRNIKI